MSTRVNRADLISRLQSVQPGLSQREILEQSSCFVFQDGYVLTFNDEIACRARSGLGDDFIGAVQAAPLLKLLDKMPDDDVDLEVVDGGNGAHLTVSGLRREAEIRMEKEVLLAVAGVEKPKKWAPLHEEFVDAVGMVATCASKDESRFNLTCIHVHPKYVEACDNMQAIRYKLKTGFSGPCLARHESLKHVISLGMTEFSETESWIHFRNPSRLIMSCRRFLEEFPNISGILDVKGDNMVLPGGLAEAVERAHIFSEDNASSDHIAVELRPGKVKITGEGVSGRFRETKKVKYDGASLEFMVAPKLLIEMTKRYKECEVTDERLKVNGGKFVYVSCLFKIPERGEVSKQASDNNGDDDGEE